MRLRPFATDRVAWFVWLSVCWSWPWAQQKQMNLSSWRLEQQVCIGPTNLVLDDSEYSRHLSNLIQRVTLSFAETKAWDLINMQNVLIHVSDRSSRLTGKRRKEISAFDPWRLLYRPKLGRHSWRICLSESWSDLVWYFGLGPKISVTSRFAYESDLGLMTGLAPCGLGGVVE